MGVASMVIVEDGQSGMLRSPCSQELEHRVAVYWYGYGHQAVIVLRQCRNNRESMDGETVRR